MLKLKEIDEKIDALYEMKSKSVARILEKKGDSVGYMKLESGDGKPLEKPWMRITLTDNLMPFSDRDVIYRTARFMRYEVKIDYLKTEPKITVTQADDLCENKKK